MAFVFRFNLTHPVNNQNPGIFHRQAAWVSSAQGLPDQLLLQSAWGNVAVFNCAGFCFSDRPEQPPVCRHGESKTTVRGGFEHRLQNAGEESVNGPAAGLGLHAMGSGGNVSVPTTRRSWSLGK